MALASPDAGLTDVLDPNWWRRDPQDAYRSLLAHDGLWRDERSQLWMVARHADIMVVERDASTFSSRDVDDKGGSYRLVPSENEATMISNDDPVHLSQRRMINRRFTPRSVRKNDEHYRAIVVQLVDEAMVAMADGGSVEVVDALAAQLPGRVTADLIGFGADRWREVKSWSERQMRIDRRYVEAEVGEDLLASIDEWAQVMVELLPQRAAEPQDDLFSDWIAGGMAPEVMVQETGLMIAGGAETTRTVIAHGLRIFADHHDQWDAMAENPELVPGAVEEMIRYITPLNNMFRRATIDTEVAGTSIAANERLALVYPAANRDPVVFDEPDRFDISRSPNPHVAFGYGTHFCLGANLARLELRLLFEEMSKRFTNLRVVTEPDIEPNIFARAVRRFDLAFDPR